MDMDAMLCDHAQVFQGKLFISGAGIDLFTLPAGAQPPYQVTFSVGGIIRVPWTATNAEHLLAFRMITEDGRAPLIAGPVPGEGVEATLGGEMRFNVGRPPQLASGDEQLVPFSFTINALPLMEGGRLALAFELDGTEVRRLKVTVVVPSVTI